MSDHSYVSMKDIAAQVGVHVSTVSLALQDSAKIRPETRQKILEAAEKLGYRHNPYLSTLMRSRRVRKMPQTSPVIGFVTSHAERDGWRKREVLLDFYDGCCQMAQDRGYRIEVFWRKDPEMSAKRLSQILYHRGIQGIILGPCDEMDSHVEMDWDLFSPVAIGHSIHSPLLHRVTNNHFLSTVRVMDYCHNMGVKRVGFAVQKVHTVRLQHRWLGAYLAKRIELGMDTDIEPLIAGVNEWKLETVKAWYNTYKPEVIIGPFGSSVGNWLESTGVKIPADVQLISVACPRMGHRVSGIFENGKSIGSKAVQMVISMIEHTEKGIPENPSMVSLEGTWNPGSTVRRPSMPFIPKDHQDLRESGHSPRLQYIL
ncbi:MAG: LacI family transcriptional regulator [Verrucomicrobia bacterium]|nr:LacI family transcriptional regulator [Verrucomicrobiota bacterium]